MDRRKFLASGLALVFFSGMCGCSGKGLSAAGPGSRVIKRVPSQGRPDWMKSVRNFWIQNGTIYYYGVSEGEGDLQSSLENAEAAAAAGLAEQLKTMLRTEYMTAMGKRNMHQAARQTIEQTLAALLDELALPRGVVFPEKYSEKVAEVRGGKTRVFYRSWVLSTMDAVEYDELFYRTAVSMKKEVKTRAAVRLADSVERKYRPSGKQEA